MSENTMEEQYMGDQNDKNNEKKMEIPPEVSQTIQTLKDAGFEAYAVGGCVRDMLRGAEPNDWDITTNATPDKVQKLFERSFYANDFGTVTVLTDSEQENLKKIEITPYRKEGVYTDARHPDEVEFVSDLKEDLARRDFTVNAMAFDGEKIVDPFGGQKDLEEGVIKAVGDPKERFGEDALRMFRAPRFATALGMKIEEKTLEAIQENAGAIEKISAERVRDEFLKMLKSHNAAEGIHLLKESGLLEKVFPELMLGEGMEQNKHHIYTVLEHNINALDYAAKEGFNEDVRIAALLHDAGKAKTKTGEGPESHFYNHEIESTNMAYNILRRLKFPKERISRITKLVRYHMFNYDPDVVTDSAVRRIIANIGPENVDDLISVRVADRMGSGCEKAEPYKVRHFRYRVEKLTQDPISVNMLKINGQDIMNELGIGGGKKIGYFKNILFGDVLEKPELNSREYLLEQLRELAKLEEANLKDLSDKAVEKIETIETLEDGEIQKKYYVASMPSAYPSGSARQEKADDGRAKPFPKPKKKS